MWTTPAEIMSAAYVGVGRPEDHILQRVEMASILMRSLSYRLELIRQSEQAISIVKSASFTLANTENSKDLTTYVDNFGIPMWVERQTVNITGSQPVWAFVSTVALSQLASRRAQGFPACSFYGDNALDVNVEFSYYGNEVATPSRVHRVWYAPSVTLPAAEDQTVAIPDNLTQILVLDTMVKSLPLMITNAAKLVVAEPSLAPMMESWKMLLDELKAERGQFEVIWEQWRKESRGGHRSRRRRDVLRRDPAAGQWIFGVRGGTS